MSSGKAGGRPLESGMKIDFHGRPPKLKPWPPALPEPVQTFQEALAGPKATFASDIYIGWHFRPAVPLPGIEFLLAYFSVGYVNGDAG